MNKSIRTDLPDHLPYGKEHDACALYLSGRKNGQSTFGTLKRALWRLSNMGHRTGYVNGEGDGTGVQTDIPRSLWGKKISMMGLPASIATQPGFWVGHLIIPCSIEISCMQERINQVFTEKHLNLLLTQLGPIRSEALGLNAQFEAPSFWQLAGSANLEDLEKRLYSVKLILESEFPIHFASLSSYTVTYKIRGSVETLSRYFPELLDRSFTTTMALCHARYSTNTVSSFQRSQPFALLGHNGEINTINQLRREAKQIGVHLASDGSDSQDVDRTLEHLCIEEGLTLFEAMEMVFPPTPYEIDRFPTPISDIYENQNLAFGPYAQGPAAICARYGNSAVCSLDAMGLRPLWFSETEKEYIFSSERGAILLEDMVTDSRPLAPGEKMGLVINRGHGIAVLSHQEIRQQVTNRKINNSSKHLVDTNKGLLQTKNHQSNFSNKDKNGRPHKPHHIEANKHNLIAAGWTTDDIEDIRERAHLGIDPVGSMGFDGPLAVLSKNRMNIADYFKETVAVVTNPAIDRGREHEAFSTRSIIGSRPQIDPNTPVKNDYLILNSPLLFTDGDTQNTILTSKTSSQKAEIVSVNQLIDYFGNKCTLLSLSIPQERTIKESINHLTESAISAVLSGAQCLILDDSAAYLQPERWIDPLLAVAAVDNALSEHSDTQNLRRKTGLIIRSASIRNLHDIVMLCGFGADAIDPYLITSLAKQQNQPDEKNKVYSDCVLNLFQSLQTGLEKVISTIGCHELRGYGRVCASIGLSPEIAAIFQSPNYFGTDTSGVNWEYFENDADMRLEALRDNKSVTIAKINHFYPKFWNSIRMYITKQAGFEAITNKYQKLIEEFPITIRHILRIRKAKSPSPIEHVDISIKDKDMPFVISAMSFGSQGEASFRAFAEAAKRLNIICINGEGGELPEILGSYSHNRGQQVASGRFGVNTSLLNSCNLIEIKIGQGAKPGEGGMLPAKKVNEHVAQARHTPAFVPLLSPSNNHDLYSIEDLAQLIEELKTVNPNARISVKCPCVPGIGVISVGVVKAGADIVNLSGYDGATGAARKHAIKHVGLPVEIGVFQSHRALIDAGIRENVEIWCDGGMKTGDDVVKIVLLGANRVGFGSMAMAAIGCTFCRKCNQGTCHAGITTHINSEEEARLIGLKKFTPLDIETSVNALIHLFRGIAQETRQLTSSLGYTHLQDLVGKSDQLFQHGYQERIDLSPMLIPIPDVEKKHREQGIGRLLTRERNQLTQYISESVLDAVREGEKEVTYQDQVMAYDRALGSHLFGALTRQPKIKDSIEKLHLHFSPSSIGGNGFAAWSTEKMDVIIEGGAQDGVAKGACGGRVAVMKGLNHDGLRIDGSVGKSFAYGAQKGLLIVQGNADSRACIRLSGADVILGGEITQPINTNNYNIGSFSNLKGYACEYMTSGRVVILGDPGPYAFSGMTGGVVYQLLTPEMGFDIDRLKSRFAQGAHVNVKEVDKTGVEDIQELLGQYQTALMETNQPEETKKISRLITPQEILSRFVMVIPK